MTEQELYIKLIPEIAKIAEQCRKMDEEKYAAWKKEIITSTPDEVRNFIRKIMAVVDKVRKEWQCAVG
jgi:preprotein translocase subunit Sss1